MEKIIAIILTVAVAFGAGVYTGYKLNKPKEIIVTQKEIEYKVIYRDVDAMPDSEVREQLKCFYTAKPYLKIYKISDTPLTIKADAKLCGREWNREAVIEVNNDSTFIYYIGAGLVAGALITFAISR